jgi:hypothetical protein
MPGKKLSQIINDGESINQEDIGLINEMNLLMNQNPNLINSQLVDEIYSLASKYFIYNNIVLTLDSIQEDEIANPYMLSLVNLALRAKIINFLSHNTSETQDQIQNDLDTLKNKTQILFNNIVQNHIFLQNNSYLFGANLLSIQYSLTNDKAFNEMNAISLSNGLSVVDLDDCFNQLRSYYNYTKDTELLVMTNNYDALINLDNFNRPLASDSFAYNIYESNSRQKLNTDICSDVKVKMPIQNKSLLNLSLYHNMSQHGIDIFDKNNSAFENRCFQLVDNTTGFDTTIGYRRENYYQNLTVDCGDNCIYTGIDNNDYLECTCNKTEDLEIKSDFENDTKLFDTNLGDLNMDIVACFSVAFRYPDIFLNNGFYSSLIFFITGLTLSVALSLCNKKITAKSLTSILYNDCEFFDRKVFTAEEYFNERDINEAIEPPPVGKVLTKVSNNNTNRKQTENENFHLTEILQNNKEQVNKEDVLVLNDNKQHGENNSEIIRNPVMLNNYNLNLSLERHESSPLSPKRRISKRSSQNNCEAINSIGKENSQSHNISIKEIEFIDEELKAKRDNIFNDKNHKITRKDYEKLTLDEIIKYDKRGFLTFVKDHIFEGHILISVLRTSLIDPIFIRVILLVYIVSMSFAFNAICFSDDYINTRAYIPERVRESFFYSVIYEFPKTVISIVLTTLLEIIARIIIFIPKSYEEEFIEAMQTKELTRIEEAKYFICFNFLVNYFRRE